jgi:hypothetical protein
VEDEARKSQGRARRLDEGGNGTMKPDYNNA